ncbi:MAG: CHAT domain-containing tetratricopeptide repeat protein [Planctomycetota bacterium]|nr:CHAT domain-containing tetratricopeptide repeat protein [Planctomycetota bacterium]
MTAVDLNQFMHTASADRIGLVRSQSDPQAVMSRLVDLAEQAAASTGAQAITALEAVRDAADSIGEKTDSARVRRALCSALASGGRFDESLAASHEAKSIATAAGALAEAGRALITSMQPLLKLGRADEAIAAGENAVQEFEALGESELAAKGRVNVANVLKAVGRHAEAIASIDAAIQESGQSAAFSMVALNTRAECQLALGQFDQARSDFSTALSIAQSDPNSFSAALILANVGDLEAQCGRAQEALDAFARATIQLKALGAEGHSARVLVEEADVYAALGDIAVAERLYADALATLQARKMKFEIARALSGLARMSGQTDASDGSTDRFAKAVAAWKACGNEVEVARTRLAHAFVLANEHNADEAELQCERARPALVGSPLDDIALWVAEAAIASERGNNSAAIGVLVKAEEQAARLKLRSAAAEMSARISDLLRSAGEIDESIAAGRRAVEYVEAARCALQAERLRGALLGVRVGAYESLVLALLQRRGSGDIEEAYDTVARAKSRSLLERLSGSVRGFQEQESSPEVQELLDRLNSLYRRMSTGGTQGERDVVVEGAVREIAQIEQRLDELASTSGESVGSSATPTWRELHCLLRPTDVLVEAFIAHDQVLLFVCQPDGTMQQAVVQMSVEQIRLHIRRLQFQVRRSIRSAAGAPGQIRAHLDELGHSLLAPIAPWISNARRVLIAPHGILHAIPFGALTLGANDAPLIQGAEVIVLPCGALLPALLEASTKSTGQPLVIGVADEAAPEIEAEARAVSELIGGELLIGAEATLERVCHELEHASVAHFACHGVYLADAARSSGLRLADGWLTVRKIQALARVPGTIILSACETGRSTISPGDEHLGLVRAFVDRGAKTVVATLWSANDRSTRALMMDFYRSRGIVNSSTDASSLRHAQNTLRSNECDPARWAPYFVTGALR